MKTIQIGPILYQVREDGKFSGQADIPNPQSLLGEHWYMTQSIVLWPNLPPQVRIVDLWHEILHALLDQIAGDTFVKDEEGLVNCFSHQIVALLYQNPDLVRETMEAKGAPVPDLVREMLEAQSVPVSAGSEAPVKTEATA